MRENNFREEESDSTGKPKLSFCIVIYKNSDVLEKMFSTLKPFILEGDEVLIHDNAPTSGDHELITTAREKHQLDIRYFSTGQNIGFGAACNLLADAATNGRIIFLNPDTQTSSFQRTAHQGNQIVGPYAFDMAGNRQSSSGTSRTVWDEFKMRWLRRFEFNNEADELSYISGVALSMDRLAFLELGGFDSRYFMYYEDVDLCHRAREHGFSVIIDPQWRINHVGGSSAKKLLLESAKRSYKSSLLFHINWGNKWVVYITFSLLDAVLRIFYHLLKMNFVQSMAYLKLVLYIGTQSRNIVKMNNNSK